MKIAFSSDFHIDASAANRRAIAAIAQRMKTADVVVVAGDAGNTLEQLAETLSFFESFDGPKLFVAGNHDVWVEASAPSIDSRAKYEVEIPAVCGACGFADLSRAAVVVDDIGFVGSLGWYDYSFADPDLGLTQDEYWRGRYDDKIWWDKEMTFWSPSGQPDSKNSRLRDPQVCREMVAALGAQIASVETRVGRVIAVVHTLPFVETLPRSDPPYYMDAFTGAASLGVTLAACPKLTHHIGGHKHLNGDWRIGNIQSSRRTLGRLEDEASIDRAVEDSIGFIEI